MKVTVIGSHLCQDTLYAIMKLKDKNVEVDFKNLSAGFPALKDFLHVRETSPLYDEIRKNGGIGMPFFELEDGTQTLSLNEVLAKC